MSYRTADSLRPRSSVDDVRGAQKMLSGVARMTRHGGQPAPAPAGRRARPPQVREPPAHRLVQAARRVRADRRACSPEERAARRRRGERRQPRAGRRAGVLAARGALHGLHAGGRPAAEGRRDPGLRRRGAAARPGRRRDAGRRAGVRAARRAPSSSTPSTTPTSSPGRARSAWRSWSSAPRCARSSSGIGGGGLARASRSR